jgi:GntR family transcriptional regulator / MocR family aminotransferase
VTKKWAISGVDLHLDLKGTRVRAALESALREAVSGGRLRPGTRLPSSRALAADLGIARNTVADAYGQLVAEGWLTAVRGSGTRVARRPAPADSTPAPEAVILAQTRYDLCPGAPDLSAFPRSAWLAAARRALSVASCDTLGYSDPRGLPELRRALADYLGRARGVRAGPEHIVICCGFTQGFWLLCRVLRASGATTLAVEQFIQQGTCQAAKENGLTLTTLRVDERGARVSELGAADAVLLTPAHQFPLGVPLAARRRAQVVEWALDTGGLIIEDDYDGEFRYDRHPLGSLQGLSPEQIVYAGTASKALAPGLRLGWLVLPGRLIDEVCAAKTLADRNTGAIDQLTLAEFIVSGAYDRHIRRSRLIYRRRRDRLVTALKRDTLGVRISGIAAGLHALVELPPGHDEQHIIARAADHGLALLGLGTYAKDPHNHPPALVVGYAKPPEHAYTSAVARLSAVLAEAARSS